MQCDITRCIIFIPNDVEYFNKEKSQSNKVEYLDKEYSCKISRQRTQLQKKLYCDFKWSLQRNQENHTGQNFVS